MKAAIYARVSTDKQELDGQVHSCREYCSRNGHDIYRIYKDVYSGAKDRRPEFNELVEDMRNYRFDMIIVTKLDRIGRSLQHLL